MKENGNNTVVIIHGPLVPAYTEMIILPLLLYNTMHLLVVTSLLMLMYYAVHPPKILASRDSIKR